MELRVRASSYASRPRWAPQGRKCIWVSAAAGASASRSVRTMRASSSSGTTLGWPVWIQGPYAQGAGGAGWRPVAAVKRRSASAGRRPVKTRRSRSPAVGLDAPALRPRRKRLVASLSTSTP